MTSYQRKIDPMGLMGKIFASIGAALVVVGVLIAALLGRFAPGGFGFYFLVLAGAWGTGMVFLLLGLVFLLFFRNIESANVVDQYLRALSNQDYATAFQYIDTGLKIPQDALDTQAWFTQRAQAQDEQGTITDYTLRNFRLQGNSAMYTIKMIRGGKPYMLPLFLMKRGDTWKISGLELF
jgi:hypothetical protein